MSDVIVIYDTDTEVVEIEVDPEVVTEIVDTEVEVVEIIEEGPQGIPGPVGDPGPPGTFDVSDVSYTHDQPVASDTWVIVHGLGFKPAAIHVEDTAHTVVEGVVSHQSANQLTVRFNNAFSGTAELS